MAPSCPLEVRSQHGDRGARRGRASHGPEASSRVGDIDHRDPALSGVGGLEGAGPGRGLSGGSGKNVENIRYPTGREAKYRDHLNACSQNPGGDKSQEEASHNNNGH